MFPNLSNFITKAIFVFLFIYTVFFPFISIPEGDTSALIKSQISLDSCLQESRYSCPRLQHFPLSQHLNSFVIHQILPSVTEKQELFLFSLLSHLSFLAILYIFSSVFKNKKILFLGITILLSGYLFYYLHSTFNEMFASFLILAFSFFLLKGKNYFFALFFGILSGITKDVIFPFLFILGMVSIFLSTGHQKKKKTVILLLSLSSSFLLNTLFNLYRYQTPYNSFLLDQTFIVESLAQKLSFFLGLFLSPNGGLFFFWPSFSILLFATFLSSLFLLKKDKKLLTLFLINLSLALVLLFQNLGLSAWFAPFGWITWGPRLTLPILPAILLLLLKNNQESIERINLGSRMDKIALVFFFFLSGLPSLFISRDYPSYFSHLFIPTAPFRQTAQILENQEYYYRFINYLLWEKKSVLLLSFKNNFQIANIPRLVSYFTLIVILLKRFFKPGSSQKENLQLKRQQLSQKYLFGQGIEIGALHYPLIVPSHVQVKYLDRMSLINLRKQYPELSEQKLVKVDIIDNGEKLNKITNNSQDFIIANHFLEHCKNPIGTIQNFTQKLKKAGIIYLSVPDKNFSFDKERPLTSFNHLLKDHLKNRDSLVHFLEWVKYLEKKKGKERKIRAFFLYKKNCSIHYHVWENRTFVSFLKKTIKKFSLPLEIIETSFNFRESICILRKNEITSF